MKLTVNHSDLRSALQMCSVTKGAKSDKLILSNVLLVADDDALGICSTDLALTVLASAPARVQEPGRCTVELQALMDVLKSAHDSLALSIERGKLRVVTDSATFSLPTLPAEDFPTIPRMGESESSLLTFSPSEFLPMLRAVSYPMGEERNGFRLAGVYMSWVGSEMDLCASDGLRMALATLPMNERHDALMIPGALVKASEKLGASRDSTELRVEWNSNHVGVDLGATMLVRRDDERFPADYRKMFQKSDVELEVNTAALRDAVGAVAAFGRGDTRAIRFTIEDGSLTIDGENQRRGSSSSSLPTAYAGPRIVAEFAAKYLVEPLSVISAPALTLGFKVLAGVGQAVTLEPVDSSLPFRQRHVVMGMEGVTP